MASRMLTVLGFIPEPGRIVIGSMGRTRVGCGLDDEEKEGCWTRVRAWKCSAVSLWRSERVERDKGDVAVFPWPLIEVSG